MTHGETSAERAARTAETVAVLGAGGTMGFAMARNIARAGISGAETIALAEGFGLDPALFLQAIQDGPVDLPYLRAKAHLPNQRPGPGRLIGAEVIWMRVKEEMPCRRAAGATCRGSANCHAP